MSRRGVYAALAGGAVVMVALVVASTGRPVEILTRPKTTDAFTRLPTITFQTTTPTPTATTTSQGAAPFDPSPLFILILQMVLVLTALAVLAVLAQLLLKLARKPRITRHDEPVFEVPSVPEELLETATQRMRLLEAGEPRNAIVAAWLNLESSAAATGLSRDPAETSTEYTARVLATWDVDGSRLADLAALYREARFSMHELGEEHRRRAIADLHVLHADLDRVAAEQAHARGSLT
jgi:Domain of unknown function (DUF4129)